MSELGFDLYLDNDTINELADAADRNLATPNDVENPTFKPGKTEGLGTWSELFVVRDTALEAPKDGPKDGSKMVFKAVLEVLPEKEGGFDKNAGKTHYYNGYIDKADLFDKSSKYYSMTARRLGVVNSLLAACGVPTDGGVAYAQWFNGEKPLVGQRTIATVRKYQYEKKVNGQKTGEIVTAVDIDGFLGLGGPSA